MKKILHIVKSAYRGTLEEQDDTVIWLSHIMKDTGINLDILLTGNSVNYLVQNQDASGLEFGSKKQTQPPKLMDDILKIIEKGVCVYYIVEDLDERGINIEEIIQGAYSLSRNEYSSIFMNYQHIFNW
jgi:sulfur relay (sulfurtransferase) DsrF/TusC family protein